MAQNPGLQIAWQGEGGDDGIWVADCSGTDPTGLLIQVQDPGGTSTRPAIASLPNLSQSLMAWKGVGNDSGIYWTASRRHPAFDHPRPCHP
jgi:hypothetical protein